MTEKLKSRFTTKIESCTLVPSSGGCFELKVDGDLIFSKLQTGQFPDEQAVTEVIAARLK